MKYPHLGVLRNVGGAEEAGTPELHLTEYPESQSDPSCSDLEIDAGGEAWEKEKSLWTHRYFTRPERNASERHFLLVKMYEFSRA